MRNVNHCETNGGGGRAGTGSRGVFCWVVGLLLLPGLRAQTPEEHASHHPVQAGPPASSPAMPGAPSAAPVAGAMPAAPDTFAPAGMGGMMEGWAHPQRRSCIRS